RQVTFTSVSRIVGVHRMNSARLASVRGVWVVLLTATSVCLFISVRSAAPAAPAPAPLPQPQKDAIDADSTPEQAVEPAKNYALQRSLPGAAAAIEKAVKLQPALLTDAKVQTPRSWNEYWFTQRAALQEQKLARNDAAGRVKIAQWLNDAGFTM